MIALAVIRRTLSLRGAKAKETKDLTELASYSVERSLRARCHFEEHSDEAEAATNLRDPVKSTGNAPSSVILALEVVTFPGPTRPEQ